VKALLLQPKPAPAVSADAAIEAERALFRRLRSRDVAALEEMCSGHGDGVRRLAWLMVGDAAAAEDIAQDALVAAWDGAGRAAEDTRLGVWLAGIAVNLCRVEIRKRARRRRRETVAAVLRDGEVTHSAERDDEARRVREAVMRLEPELREVIVLRFLRQMPVADAAAALGIPEGTVKSRTHTGLQRLRGMLPDMEF